MKFNKKVMESSAVAIFAFVIAVKAVTTTNVTTQAAQVTQEEFTEEIQIEDTQAASIAKTERNLVSSQDISAEAQDSKSETAAVEMLTNAEAVAMLTGAEVAETETEAPETELEAPVAESEVPVAEPETPEAESEIPAIETEQNTIIIEPIQKVSEAVSPWVMKLMPNVEEYLNVRTEASDEAEVAGKIYKGSVAEIVERGDVWTKISSGNVEGYVKNEFCVVGAEAESLANQQGVTYATAVTGGVRVRALASTAEDIEILDVLEEGKKVTVDKEAAGVEGWVAIKTNDKTGYVNAEYVTVDLELGKAISIEEERAAIAAAEAEKAKKAQKAQSTSGARQQKESTEASYDDVTLLGAIIQCEAGSESYEGKVAVGAVVMNRLRAGYAGSISGVIYQPGQFSPASSGKLARVLNSGVSGSCIQAAQEALGGVDNVNGAKSFKSASSGRDGIVIGNHVFY